MAPAELGARRAVGDGLPDQLARVGVGPQQPDDVARHLADVVALDAPAQAGQQRRPEPRRVGLDQVHVQRPVGVDRRPDGCARPPRRARTRRRRRGTSSCARRTSAGCRRARPGSGRSPRAGRRGRGRTRRRSCARGTAGGPPARTIRIDPTGRSSRRRSRRRRRGDAGHAHRSSTVRPRVALEVKPRSRASGQAGFIGSVCATRRRGRGARRRRPAPSARGRSRRRP